MTNDTRPTSRETTLYASVTLHHPAAEVAAFVLDWGNDPLWRSHVRSFTATPPGRARPGQQLVEELTFAGLRFTTPTVIERADDLSAAYAGGSPTVAVTGVRTVVAHGPSSCVLSTTTRLRFGGLIRPFVPLLTPSYRRLDAADLAGLPAVLAELGPAQLDRTRR